MSTLSRRTGLAAANQRPTGAILASLGMLGLATVAGAALLSRRVHPPRSHRGRYPKLVDSALFALPPSPVVDRRGAVHAGRRLNRAAGTIATSVLIDSAMEHYRGAFANKAMYTPLAVSALAIAASFHGHRDHAPAAHRARDAIYTAAGLTGIVGTAFHIYNITKRPGGICWQNLFYAAPLGAPAAISLSGMVGFLAERVRDNVPGTVPKVLGLPAGRVVSALTGVGLLGTVAEAGLLHFRGAFHNPAMLLPVTVPPAAAAFLGAATIGPAQHPRAFTRWWLRLTALLGVVGVGFHAIGVARNMGDWRNWTQNLQAGPPLPAPPSFTGLALAGLAALGLLHDNPDD
ncbi:hypothetical protein [Acidisphaera rubrifaciens]|uniref:Uncharacterized protein n=1 Tax=Acidisphaera rubrifaciens HS-AP3 TaxID=1231350 RepID=A0A0D6P714_9PROT|nr:hypothetical protein [Acidisphaera rubrifaciens]GAN77467.1 hypothetical protein Asru_0328_02 [Acidisphaera rubrifaciens HS-AP3]